MLAYAHLPTLFSHLVNICQVLNISLYCKFEGGGWGGGGRKFFAAFPCREYFHVCVVCVTHSARIYTTPRFYTVHHSGPCIYKWLTGWVYFYVHVYIYLYKTGWQGTHDCEIWKHRKQDINERWMKVKGIVTWLWNLKKYRKQDMKEGEWRLKG